LLVVSKAVRLLEVGSQRGLIRVRARVRVRLPQRAGLLF
jgi:hypothetical protein